MKTQYYTADNIDRQAQAFLKQLPPLTELQKNKTIVPARAALLVVDMQRFFGEPSYHALVPSITAIIPRLRKLQDLFLRDNFMVLQTQHGNKLENCGQLHNWWGSFTDADDPLAAIIAELQNPRIPIIKKTQYDAFWQTGLEQMLHANNITQIIITGVMTHLCCETTARAGFVRGFEVFFAVDGTATYNAEFHGATLRNLTHGFAKPVLVSDIIKMIYNGG
jgi:isochorismate hydrolase